MSSTNGPSLKIDLYPAISISYMAEGKGLEFNILHSHPIEITYQLFRSCLALVRSTGDPSQRLSSWLQERRYRNSGREQLRSDVPCHLYGTDSVAVYTDRMAH